MLLGSIVMNFSRRDAVCGVFSIKHSDSIIFTFV